jgi:EmrB/QacA subfamily drug resistance transporter
MPALDRKWWTLIAVCTATFMLLLDITVVNVALPDIQHSLHSTFSDIQWVVDAYSLTLAAFLLTAGVIGDMFGRREVFAVGLGIFSVASLVCGLSTTSIMLNLARAAQGVGGAIMFATSLALIAAAFTGRERGTAFGIYGAVLGGAVAVGPLVGGAITSGIGWRWIFFVNVPVGVIAVIITLTQIQESKDANERRIDWIGFISFSGSLFLLILALIRGNDDGWSSPLIVGLLAGAFVLMTTFLVAEWKQADPMLDLKLFTRPAMTGVSFAAFTLAASIFALFLYITLYIQDDLGYGPLAAGVRFLPLTVLAFLVAPIAGKLTVRIHARYMLGIGLLLIAGGCLAMGFTHSDSTWPDWASAPSTRSWPRRPSRWCLPSAAAWPQGPTAPSARWASPPASPGWAPCSSPSCRRRPWSTCRPRPSAGRWQPTVAPSCRGPSSGATCARCRQRCRRRPGPHCSTPITPASRPPSTPS